MSPLVDKNVLLVLFSCWKTPGTGTTMRFVVVFFHFIVSILFVSKKHIICDNFNGLPLTAAKKSLPLWQNPYRYTDRRTDGVGLLIGFVTFGYVNLIKLTIYLIRKACTKPCLSIAFYSWRYQSKLHTWRQGIFILYPCITVAYMSEIARKYFVAHHKHNNEIGK